MDQLQIFVKVLGFILTSQKLVFGVGHAKTVSCPISLYQCFTLGLKAFHHIKRLFESQGTGSIFLQRTQKNLHLQALAIENFSGSVEGNPRYTKKWRFIYRSFPFYYRPKNRQKPTMYSSCPK